MAETNSTSDIAAELARRARDAAYVAVGLGVLGFQRAQVARHELLREDHVDEGVARARREIATGAQRVSELLDSARALLSSQLEPLGAQLPEPARGLASKACAGLETLGEQLRQLVSPGA
jgi:hypothetical protein